MKDEQEITGLTRVGIIGVLTALAALGTILIRVPIPATTGYFNIGDIFVILAGLWLGPVAGLIVGGVGPTVADAIGFPQFILATAVTKGLEGLLVGLIAGRKSRSLARKIFAFGVGALTIVVGYFTFEAFVYPLLATKMPMFAVTDLDAALIEILPNSVQGVIAAVVGLSLWRALGGSGSPSSGSS